MAKKKSVEKKKEEVPSKEVVSEEKITFDFGSIENKWQNKWEEAKIFEVKEGMFKEKFYALEMYPYPSSTGLHIGHAFNYTICDIYSRYKRMNGFNVLHPMGYDSFGLPAENAAIKANIHPKTYTDTAIANFMKQQKSLGLSYDWTRKLQSHDPNYYKWNQFFFLEFLKNGLAYRKKASVNWCSKCNSVLANEQVHQGKCWRHKEVDVEVKQLEQWFLKTSKYSEELVEKIKDLNWPERIKIMQENWIGKSNGIEIDFEIDGKKWPIFTTRPDTIFGVSFMVVSAQHPRLSELVKKEQETKVEAFLKKIKTTSEKDTSKLDKEGAFTGSYAINPVNGDKIPVYTGNFVVAEYGSGMVMAVPAHDERDFQFAKKFKIPIRPVIRPRDHDLIPNLMKSAFVGEGTLVNSGAFNGVENKDAIVSISDFIEKNKYGKRIVQYKLRDWLLSRQRYWGTPIPVVYCNVCGMVPVKEKDLPVLLPEDVRFGEGNPLSTSNTFLDVNCPKCGAKSRRETDTMDVFFDSSWYFLRFCDPNNKDEPFKKSKVKYWMPVDLYVGGAEHATMHLIFARFFTKVLRDLGYLKFDEPFIRLFNQGMVHGEDGVVMSKSRGNVVDPLSVSNKFGADTLRLFLVSVSAPDKDSVWSNKGIESLNKYLVKTINKLFKIKIGKSSDKIAHKVNKAVKIITTEIENFQYNLSVIKIRDLLDSLEDEISKEDIEKIIKLLSPFCPHIAEELWEKIGNKQFVSVAEWPSFNEHKINEKFDLTESASEKVIGDIQNIIRIMKEKSKQDAKKAYLYVIPKELEFYDIAMMKKKLGIELSIYAVNDANKFDPQNKSSKAKPGKPGLYIE